MGFSQATITGVNPPVYSGFQIYLAWTTTSPAGTWFQIYINRALAWWGQTTNARLAIPTVGPDRVDIGTVDPGKSRPTSPARCRANRAVGPSSTGSAARSRAPTSPAFRSGSRLTRSASGTADLATAFSIRRSSRSRRRSPHTRVAFIPTGSVTAASASAGSARRRGHIPGSPTAALERDLVVRRRTVRLGRQSRGGGGDVGHDPRAAAAAGVFGDNLRLDYTYDPADQEVTLLWNASPG